MSQGTRPRSNLKLILMIIGSVGLVLLLFCGGIGWFAYRTIHQLSGTAELPDGMTYNQWRKDFQSELIKLGPAPQDYSPVELIPNVEEVEYRSGKLTLQAWVYRPKEVQEPAPALLFLHGGFAFGMGDIEACMPAIDRGFVVMAPTYRGENGNPGNFEMMLGEVDDARAAAQWLAEQDYVNPDQIYAFGHSVGGGVSAVLSLLENARIQHCGSSGGLYPPTTFIGWARDVPFKNTPEERMARLLLGNIAHMQRPHYAYLGQSDSFHDAIAMAKAEAGTDSLLHTQLVPGDHFSSFEPALKLYLEKCAGEENELASGVSCSLTESVRKSTGFQVRSKLK